MTEVPKPPDRRIGERLAIEPIDVAWVLMTQPQGRFRRRAPVESELPGRVVDVSVTGAGIEGPEHPDLLPRTLAVVAYAGGRSVVRIRRKVSTNRPGVVFYGVDLERLDPALREAIFSMVGEGRPGENAWRRAW